MAEPLARDARRPVLLVMAGTGVVGLSGLVILVLTASVLGAEDYAVFGLFWSALFFIIAALSGAQQEATRAATSPRAGEPRGSSLLTFAVLLALGAGLVVAASSPWWAPPTLGPAHEGLALLVAAGSAAYVLMAVVCAVLAAGGRWGVYCAMNVTEGVVRAGAVAAALALTQGTTTLAWAVVVAYPVVLLFVAVPALRGRHTSVRVGDSLGRLFANTAQTLLAAVAVAALINGFPLLMATFSGGASTATLGAMTLAVMVTRAPLLVPLVGAQSLLITMFSAPGRSPWPLIVRLLGVVTALAAVLSALAGAIGPYVLRHTVGPNFALPGTVLTLLVASSGVLAALSMTSPALLAANGHGDYVAGWVIATVMTVVVLAVAPWDLELRAPVSLIAGPAVGLAWHLAAIARRTRRPQGAIGPTA